MPVETGVGKMPDSDKPTADGSLVMSFKIHKQKKRGRTVLRDGERPGEKTGEKPDVPIDSAMSGRIPRISRLMALAIHLQNLVDQGVVQDYAEIARLTGLTRARVTQLMNLNLLSPRIQEEILFLPKIYKGKDMITERNIRTLVKIPFWQVQMKNWRNHLKSVQLDTETDMQ
jgi:hypothetical protein